MTDTSLSEAVYPTPDEIQAQILSDIRYAYGVAGLVANAKRNSELEKRALAYSKRVALAIANQQLAVQDINPYKAVGDALENLAAFFGVAKRPATAAAGFVLAEVLSPATSVTVPSGYRGTEAGGTTYEVSATTVASDGDPVPVLATEGGSETDADAGAIVTWDSSSVAFLAQKATVATGGIDGGADEDTEEILRTRLLRRLGFPEGGGNAAQVASLAEESNTAITFAGVFPAARGPGSYDVAIMTDEDDPELGLSVISTAEVAINGELPGHTSLNVTSVTQELLDVIINATTPPPVAAGGVGGGWTDVAPWPSTNESGIKAKVTGLPTSGNSWVLTVNSTSADPPLVGTRFAIWDPGTDTMKEFAALAIGGSTGAYEITLDVAQQSLVAFIVADMYCSPAAEELQTYAEIFKAQMVALGHGEKTEDPDLLQWARRRPSPDVERPYTLTSQTLNAISDAQPEVSDLSYAARFETGTTTTRTTPSVPATVAQAPRRLGLQNLAFRAIA